MTFPLIQMVQESINDKALLKAIFIAGIPAAGKSYTVSQIQDGALPLQMINTDNMIEFFHRKGLIDMSVKDQQRQVLDQAKKSTKEALYHSLNGMLPLIIDSTSSNEANVIRRKGLLQSLGYDVSMVFVNVDVETAVSRAAQRERAVDEEFIRRSYGIAEENKEYFKGEFSNFVELSNNGTAIDNSTISQAVRAVSGWLSSPLKNPSGRRLLEKMKQQNAKYLTPDIVPEQELRTAVESWYR
ncbi:Zeta toxin [compost metagenome]